MSGASERAKGQAIDPVLTSLFLFVPDHSAAVVWWAEAAAGVAVAKAVAAVAVVAATVAQAEKCPEWGGWSLHRRTMVQNSLILRR